MAEIAFISRAIAAFSLTLGGSPAAATDAAHPTVVELFQSQGCSSCPPAIANINAMAGRPDILALTFAVTYWDRYGWKDTFAQPRFTARQVAYSHAGRGPIATPQTIVNGRFATNGGDRAQLIGTIRKADRGRSGPAISVAGSKIRIGNGVTGTPATIWLVRYDPRPLEVPIRGGENRGRTLVHRNVVRSLEPLGIWRGEAVSVASTPPADPHLRWAVLVQAASSGAIIAATRL